MIDRTKFFTSVKDSVFHNHLKQTQVDGMNFILDEWEKREDFTDLRWLAYMLGTSFHETAGTMMPIHEYGNDAYFTRMYDIKGKRPEVARSMGNVNPGDGIKYSGRGYVQLTWEVNYRKMGEKLSINLVDNPDLAMEPDVAIKIMFLGMTSEDLKFTFSRRNLKQYFNDSKEDWYNARKIVNGLDHAELIAGTSQDFYDAVDP